MTPNSDTLHSIPEPDFQQEINGEPSRRDVLPVNPAAKVCNFKPSTTTTAETTTTIIKRAKAALIRLERDTQTWADWCDACMKLLEIQTLAMAAAHTNTPHGPRYRKAVKDLLICHELYWINKGTRSLMCEVAHNLDAIESWRATLLIEEQLELNHPRVVLSHWKRSLSNRGLDGDRAHKRGGGAARGGGGPNSADHRDDHHHRDDGEIACEDARIKELQTQLKHFRSHYSQARTQIKELEARQKPFAPDSIAMLSDAEHRLRQCSADACISETESVCAQAELGIENVDAPDLQALVAAHGGYDKITAETWAEYDRAMQAYHAARREKYRRR